MAFEDGSDIITASIGGMVGWSEVPWSVAVSRIVAVSSSLFSFSLNYHNACMIRCLAVAPMMQCPKC